MKKHIGKYFWDFILCVFISAGLAENIFAGFEMADPWSGNLLAVAGIVAAVTVLLFLGYYNRMTMVISMTAQAAALIAVMVILQQRGLFSAPYTIDGNPILFWIIVISTSCVVFWAARTRAGLVVLFLVGTTVTAAFDFLEYPVCRWGYLAFVGGAFILFLYRVYCISHMYSETEKTAFNVYFAQSVIAGTMALLLASGAYYSIIKPMSPPADKLNLAQKLMSMDILYEIGVASTRIIYSDDPATTAENENQQNTNDDNYNENIQKQNEPKKDGEIVPGRDPITALAVTFRQNAKMIWIAAASAILILVLAVIIKFLLRKKWYDSLLKETNEDSAIELYNYFLKKLIKAGFRRPDGLTLLEYASGLQYELENFSVGKANILSLTQIYTRILYGCQKISEDERELFHDFYKEFYRNLKNEMGNFRYLIHFFTI
ncbi:MAG TPA: hypothetical protein DD738_03760 [Ruminiclostridium sp.]|jgi:hypothetical protein|nr:hypothetical protein [Ruminiclostridium sp.]